MKGVEMQQRRKGENKIDDERLEGGKGKNKLVKNG
jgi:hypothetical protein